ncbi:MAG: 4'-phosphopantetheinyl transferase superfamily protein, partial [Planctomycetota bacterium]|nr:4'-phosphopantetheinyl transferase superfamily protein [Planctomycetota bacterium]
AVHPDTFLKVAFTEEDLAQLPANADRDEWITRLWCAKEAHAKQAGEGITQPKSLKITAIEAETIFVNETPIHTIRHDGWIIAHTS